jgi:carboxyl-terminal processing protease
LGNEFERALKMNRTGTLKLHLVAAAILLGQPAIAQPASDESDLSTAPPRTVEQLTAEQTAEREQSLSGALGGIGTELVPTNGVLVVKRVLPGGPAERAGVKAGWLLRAINGVPAKSMKLNDAVKLIRGPAGTAVELELVPPGQPARKLTLTRSRILIEPVEARMLDGGLMVVRIRKFDQLTAGQVREVLGRLGANGATAVILDLRDENGGRVDVIAEIAGCFVGRDRILWLFQAGDGRPTEVRSPAAALTDLPVAVWVTAQTHAGELIASAIQRNQRGKIIGQHTSGTTASKRLVKDPDGNSRLEPVGIFLARPDQPITGVGVLPDTVLPASASEKDFVRAVRESLSPGSEGKPAAAERLQKLKELRDQGLLTPAEYEYKRREILDSL